jgi:hypothetical protein
MKLTITNFLEMKKILFIIAVVVSFSVEAQIGIFNTDPKASIDISAVNPANPASDEGVLIPKLTAFPSINPGVDQHSMLIYMDNAAAPSGKGFYFWNNTAGTWDNIGASVWGGSKNAVSDPLILPLNTTTSGYDIAVMDNGFVGLGTDQPDSELELESSRVKLAPNIGPELTIENLTTDSELQLIPGGVGSSYTFAAMSGITDGLKIYENTTEVLEVKRGGDLRIDNLKTANNVGIVYPASLYAESDGTINVSTSYSRLNDLKINLKNFSSVEMCETNTSFEEVYTSAFYTYVVTPTQDILLEISYHVGADIFAFGGGIPNSNDTRHNTKIYGIILRINDVDFSTMTAPMISNQGLNGYFHLSDHLYMPLVADGTTYTITLHGLVQNDEDVIPPAGIRGVFGGNSEDRIQIIEHL